MNYLDLLIDDIVIEIYKYLSLEDCVNFHNAINHNNIASIYLANKMLKN